jgi:hypothetical protein
MFRGVVDGIEGRDDNRKILAVGLPGMDVFNSAPADSKFGLQGEFPVVEDEVTKGKARKVVDEMNGIGRGRVDGGADVDGRGEHMVFGADNEFVIDDPVEAEAEVEGKSLLEDLGRDSLDADIALAVEFLSGKERPVGGGVFFHHLRAGEMIYTSKEQKQRVSEPGIHTTRIKNNP